MKLLIQLATVFLKVGTFTIGGGYAMVPAIKGYVVDRYKYLSEQEFLDIIAITQSMPGPLAVNVAFFVGYKLKKSIGGIVAVIAAVLPSLVIMLLVAMGFREIKDNFYVIAAFKGIRPTVVALVFLATISLGKTAKVNQNNIAIPMVVAVAIVIFDISPLLIIVISFVAGNLYWAKNRGQR